MRLFLGFVGFVPNGFPRICQVVFVSRVPFLGLASVLNYAKLGFAPDIRVVLNYGVLNYDVLHYECA